MTAQTSYSILHAAGYEGGTDSNEKVVVTGRVNTVAEIPAGRFVVYDTGSGTSELAVKLPASAADVFRGAVLLDQAHVPTSSAVGYAKDEIVSVLRQGNILCVTEEAVTPADPVYVRFNATGATGTTPAVGRVRKSPDGVAEVNTLTPTAANAQLYSVGFSINGRTFEFSYLSDASATATEICDGLRAAMAADAAFTALVVATGTATLILTSQQAGIVQNVTSHGTGTIAIVATTPAAPTAVRVPGLAFGSAVAAGGLAWVNVNLPA